MRDLDLPVKITWHRCANGETWEFRLVVGDTVARTWWKKVYPTDDGEARIVAARILGDLFSKREGGSDDH